MVEPQPEAAVPARISPFALFAPHPKGLTLLFFTELWERFSFYGMRALLILYLTKYLSFPDQDANAIYGAYTALVYIGPVLGGLLADRILGPRRAVAFGGILIALGHFTLAIGGPAAITVADPSFGTMVLRDERALQLFYLALGLIITGEAFFKPNISTLVGKLYGPGDPRRDAGFTLFYMGINLGAFAATLLCGYLAERWGWGYGFGAAGIGMLIALATFLRGLPALGNIGDAPDTARLRKRVVGPIDTELSLYIGGVLAVGLAMALVQRSPVVSVLLGIVGAAGVGALVAYAIFKQDREGRDRLFVALGLSAFAVIFIALFEQAGSSLNLFTDRNVDRHIFGATIATAQFQSVNPFFILLLAPLFSRLWPALEMRGVHVSVPAKFAAGLALVGAGFAGLVIAAAYGGRTGEIACIWLILAYLLHTAGELCLQPIGLSMITKLSPREILGFTMGIWFLATAAGQKVAAGFASLASVPVSPDGHFDRVASLHTYTNLFGILAVIAFLAALLLFGIRAMLHQRMHGVD
jgi:POT family proton-dependent oligopeptide transporter